MKFKVLTYQGQWVDELRLTEGIYTKDIPTLHSEDSTIDSIIESKMKFLNAIEFSTLKTNQGVPKINFKENIGKCELIEFFLSPIDYVDTTRPIVITLPEDVDSEKVQRFIEFMAKGSERGAIIVSPPRNMSATGTHTITEPIPIVNTLIDMPKYTAEPKKGGKRKGRHNNQNNFHK